MRRESLVRVCDSSAQDNAFHPSCGVAVRRVSRASGCSRCDVIVPRVLCECPQGVVRLHRTRRKIVAPRVQCSVSRDVRYLWRTPACCASNLVAQAPQCDSPRCGATLKDVVPVDFTHQLRCRHGFAQRIFSLSHTEPKRHPREPASSPDSALVLAVAATRTGAAAVGAVSAAAGRTRRRPARTGA